MFAKHLQLVDSRRTEIVTGSKQYLHPPLALYIKGKLSRESSLTGTVQTGNQHNSRLSLDIDVRILASHQLCQLVVDNLDDHLLRFHGSEDILAYGLFLYIVAELLCNLVAHVRIKQGSAYILHRFRNVDFGNLSFTFQYFE